jgi:hypothetical protein
MGRARQLRRQFEHKRRLLACQTSPPDRPDLESLADRVGSFAHLPLPLPNPTFSLFLHLFFVSTCYPILVRNEDGALLPLLVDQRVLFPRSFSDLMEANTAPSPFSLST